MIHKPKKALGQNFLKSTLALSKIIEAGEIKNDDIVLEIGPGKGVLTAKLLEKSGVVVAIEKDTELFEFLKNKFAQEILDKKLILLNEDILEFNVRELNSKFFSSPRISGSLSQPDHSKNLNLILSYKIIANIPYNITGAILKKFLTTENQPERMILMVQNEVAKRIVAQDKKESILSISVKAYGESKLIMKVPARYFSPAPKVDSAILSIKNINRAIFTKNEINEEDFWQIVKAGFAHKRKILYSNLKTGGFSPILKRHFDILKLENKRAEDITISDWIELTKILTKS